MLHWLGHMLLTILEPLFSPVQFGYQGWFQVAEVVTNYSADGTQLETMDMHICYGPTACVLTRS